MLSVCVFDVVDVLCVVLYFRGGVVTVSLCVCVVAVVSVCLDCVAFVCSLFVCVRKCCTMSVLCVLCALCLFECTVSLVDTCLWFRGCLCWLYCVCFV